VDTVITTRFYDINITATDATGNIGVATCTVIVIPMAHYDLESGGMTPKGTLPKGGTAKFPKGSKSKSKSGQAVHNWQDLRLEYALSSQRYVITELSLLFDPKLDTTLVVPPLPEVNPTVTKGPKSKGVSKVVSKKGMGPKKKGPKKICPRFCPETGGIKAKGKNNMMGMRLPKGPKSAPGGLSTAIEDGF
jgi:hypothetical protein